MITETVEEIRHGAARLAADEPREDRLAQVVQLVVRVVATLPEIDDRLGRAADQNSAAQTDAQRLKSKTHFWIVLGQVIAVLVIAGVSRYLV